jgi:hypothetical protein
MQSSHVPIIDRGPAAANRFATSLVFPLESAASWEIRGSAAASPRMAHAQHLFGPEGVWKYPRTGIARIHH